MYISALCSIDVSEHGCTQFGAYPLVPIDAGLDSTYFEVAISTCEAVMPVSLTSTRADGHTCTFQHFFPLQCQSGDRGSQYDVTAGAIGIKRGSRIDTQPKFNR